MNTNTLGRVMTMEAAKPIGNDERIVSFQPAKGFEQQKCRDNRDLVGQPQRAQQQEEEKVVERKAAGREASNKLGEGSRQGHQWGQAFHGGGRAKARPYGVLMAARGKYG